MVIITINVLSPYKFIIQSFILYIIIKRSFLKRKKKINRIIDCLNNCIIQIDDSNQKYYYYDEMSIISCEGLLTLLRCRILVISGHQRGLCFGGARLGGFVPFWCWFWWSMMVSGQWIGRLPDLDRIGVLFLWLGAWRCRLHTYILFAGKDFALGLLSLQFLFCLSSLGLVWCFPWVFLLLCCGRHKSLFSIFVRHLGLRRVY